MNTHAEFKRERVMLSLTAQSTVKGHIAPIKNQIILKIRRENTIKVKTMIND